MGSTHRQKVTSKVIFLLHCTGLAQLSFYASVVGAYNFTICNHTAIKTDYRYVLQKLIESKLSETNIKTIKNCCPIQSEARLLGCIYYFTKVNFFTKINLSRKEIWNFTNALLKTYCPGNSKVNGSQTHGWTKCNEIPRHSNMTYELLELREMWNSYVAFHMKY